MGNRYYAHITFPVGALKIPEVKECYDESPRYLEIEDDGAESGLVQIGDSEANYGRFNIEFQLRDAGVPFDVYHSESESGGAYTWHVRFNEAGECVETETDDASEERLTLAATALHYLQNDRLDLLERELRGVIHQAPERLDREWEPA